MLKAIPKKDLVVVLKNPSNRAISKTISTLNLSSKELTNDDLQTILSILPASNNIQKLDLKTNSIGVAVANVVISAFINSPNLGNLIKLGLGTNGIGTAGATIKASATLRGIEVTL